MRRRNPALRLHDMVEAIEFAHAEASGLTLDEFEQDRRRLLVVERCIDIVSEASRHLPAELKARHPDIPWARVARVGNILRHDYERVAPDVLWSILSDHLTILEAVCRAELAALRAGDAPP